MIERYVFIKLTPEHADAAGRRALADRSRELSQVPGVRALRVGLPADPHAEGAWDLSLALQFDDLAAVAAYIQHPLHRAYVDEFLKPRLEVLKYWNFEV